MNNAKKKNRANAGRSPRSFGPDKPLAVEGIYNNALFMHALANQIGNTIRVETQNGITFEGIFKAYSSNFEVALGMTHKVDPSNPSNINVDEVKEVLIFKPQEIVCITATDVDLEYATRDTFQTDTAISKFNGQILGERELEPWVGPGCNGGDELELDVNDANANGWDVNDMFRKNEQLYGVQSTFDHNMSEYTVQLQKKDTKDYKDAEAKAAKIASEIESNPSHRARVDVENGDEEEKYASVVRPDSGNTNNANNGNVNNISRSNNNNNSNNSSSSSSSSNNNASNSSSSSDSGKYVPPAKRKNQLSGKLGAKSQTSTGSSNNQQHAPPPTQQLHQPQPTAPPSSISPVLTPVQPSQPQSQSQPPPPPPQSQPPQPQPLLQPQAKKQSPPLQYHHAAPLPFAGPPNIVSQPPPPQPYPPAQPLPQRERQDQRVNGQIDQLPPTQPKGPRPPASSYPLRAGPRGPYQSEYMSGNRYQPVDISQPRVPPPQAGGGQPHHHMGPPARNAPAPPPPHLHHSQHVPHSTQSQMNQGGQMMSAPYPPNTVPSMPPGVHPAMQAQPPQHIPPIDMHRKSPAANIVSDQHTAPSLPPRKQNPRRDDQLSELKKFGNEFKLADSNATPPPSMPVPNHTEHDVRKQIPPPQHQPPKSQPSPPQQQQLQSPQRQVQQHQQQQPPPHQQVQQHQQQPQQQPPQDRQLPPPQHIMKNDKSSALSPSDDKSTGADGQSDNSTELSSVDKVTSTLKKSTLNPNAKEFVYNPNAKPFTPVSNRSPSTPVASRPHTPQTPNYPPMPMVMPAYVVATQPTYPPSQAAGNRYRKVQIVPHHRSDLTTQMTAAAVTGQPLLAPAPLHANFTVPYPGSNLPPNPYHQMVRMVPQVPLVPTSISYHEPPSQPQPTIQFMPPHHHSSTPSPAHNGPGNQTPQNGHPPPSYGQSSGASSGGGQHSSSGVGSYTGQPGHPPPYHPIMCPIMTTGPPSGPPGAHHAAAMAAATQQQFIHHHQQHQLAGQHPQHIQVILPQNQ